MNAFLRNLFRANLFRVRIFPNMWRATPFRSFADKHEILNRGAAEIKLSVSEWRASGAQQKSCNVKCQPGVDNA